MWNACSQRSFCVAAIVLALSLGAAAEPALDGRDEACSIPIEYDLNAGGYTVVVPVSVKDASVFLTDLRDPHWKAWADALGEIELLKTPRRHFASWHSSRSSFSKTGSWTIEKVAGNTVVLVERMAGYGKVYRSTISYQPAPGGVRITFSSEELHHRYFDFKGLSAATGDEERVLRALYSAFVPLCWRPIPTQCRPGCRHNEHCERSPDTFKPRCVGDIRPCGPTTCTTWNEECRVLETGFQCIKGG